METGLVAALGGAAALLLIALCALLAAVFTDRRRTRRELTAACADLEVLRARLDEIEAARKATITPAVVPQAEYLITTAGDTEATDTDPERVPNRAVLSVTFGEPLVKAMALGYGVRRALSPQTRNRITFEMRREVRRARKARRRAGRKAARADVSGTGRREAAA